jgi:hypothetical protein
LCGDLLPGRRDSRLPLGRQVYRQNVRKRELACVGLIVSSTAG